ncbi:MAG: hypothetical protein H7338_16025, partial [Candidatus Sericytochromatia bacterium]|nr:hypothetical protein [Candidatus Sericytochromatia bacterium]
MATTTWRIQSRQAGALIAALSLMAGCVPTAMVPLRRSLEAGPTFAAATATRGVTGQATVAGVPLANATIYVHDPIANAKPGPSSGDADTRLTYDGPEIRTDAEGRFSLPLTVKPGQAAYLFISDGSRAMTALIGPSQTAYGGSGLVAFSPAHPLQVDADTTITASLLVGKMAAMGRFAAAGAKGFLVQARVLNVLNFGAGKGSFQLKTIGGTDNRDAAFATSLARRMANSDPRVTRPPRALRTKREIKLVQGIFNTVFATKAAATVEIGESYQASVQLMAAIVEVQPKLVDTAMGIIVAANTEMVLDAVRSIGNLASSLGPVLAQAADIELVQVTAAAEDSPTFRGDALNARPVATTTGATVDIAASVNGQQLVGASVRVLLAKDLSVLADGLTTDAKGHVLLPLSVRLVPSTLMLP